MSATNFFEDDLMDLIITNVDCPNVGDAAGLQNSAAAGSWHISLHTATLAETHTLQTQSEAAYTNYARQAVARSTAQWTVGATPGLADNDNAITFPQSGSGPETETDFGMGFVISGAGNLQIYDALAASLIVNNLTTPEFAAGALDISLD